MKRIEPRPRQESVWDYPRPPRLEPVSRRIRVIVGGITIADSIRAFRVLETSHPPVYYIPRDDIRMEYLVPREGSSFCEWKGSASYWDAEVSGVSIRRIAWSYERPSEPFQRIAGHLAFYASKADACYVDDERVEPQPGGFYGGWITSDVAGPFKGEPGSSGW